MNYVYYGGELYHYGVDGQKHGVRNYQNEDGSYTDLGQSQNNGHGRYATEVEGSRTPKQIDRAYPNHNKKDNKLTDKQKRILIGTMCGMAIGAGICTAYYIKNRNITNSNDDVILKPGTIFQRMSKDKDEELYDVFYAAFDEKDKKRYEKTLPYYYNMQGYKNVVKKEISFDREIKIAGYDTCKKLYEKMLNDNEFINFKKESEDVNKWFNPFFKLLLEKKDDYDSFNMKIVEANAKRDKDLLADYNKFYDRLKELGYSGLLDVNDQRGQGYQANYPVVIFNNLGAKVNVSEKKYSNAIRNGIKFINEQRNMLNDYNIKHGGFEQYIRGGAGTVARYTALGFISGKIFNKFIENKKEDEEKRKEDEEKKKRS